MSSVYRIRRDGPLCRLRKAQRCKELKVRCSLPNLILQVRSPLRFKFHFLSTLANITFALVSVNAYMLTGTDCKGACQGFFHSSLQREWRKRRERKISSRARMAKRLQTAGLFGWEATLREIQLWASWTEAMQSEWKCDNLRRSDKHRPAGATTSDPLII